ncbi:MAG: UDP-glucose 4-epimerase [Clostridiales bacterium 38-18]|nr:MAG: UDP-glucose 4-epimerase [Clostridiales bacterium 38-18]
MKKILITGACGQIGTELTHTLRKLYGVENVVATNIRRGSSETVENEGIFEELNVTDYNRMLELVKKYEIDTIMNLAALLSAVGEKNPQLLWDVNMNGLYNCLEVARETGAMVFTPSSIAAFGPSTPADLTPQDTIQRPTTIYGVSKVAGELLCDYYFNKFGVDTRGVRFPGLISYSALPGGGTTDYAVHIYYEALKNKKFTCNLAADTYMDMMYMPDAIESIIQLCEAEGSKLVHRNAFNITAMSFCPEDIKKAIQKHIPEFEMDYEIDEVKQKIANSWPNSLDDSCARAEWGWNPKFDLEKMTADMIEKLTIKLDIK